MPLENITWVDGLWCEGLRRAGGGIEPWAYTGRMSVTDDVSQSPMSWLKELAE